MKDIEKIKREIIERLKPLRPKKVILFGSFAYGNPHKDSDLDLYIVTNDDFIPKNWKENSQIYLKVANSLDDIMAKVAIDLIVHTKKMYEEFKNLNSSFYKYDIKRGQILWQQN
jgi:predicted nucleotidyltransferase